MEGLTDSEIKLIKAVRAMDEAPANILLWYTVGLEESAKKIESIDKYRANKDREKIKIANSHLKKM